MARGWTNGTDTCGVDDDGVHFDVTYRAPLDMDWGCPLERYLEDPSYADHVRRTFPDGTEGEVRAEVLATLRRLGRPVPVAVPVPAPPLPPLPFGQEDANALALALLVARLARVLDPSVPTPAGVAWGPPEPQDDHGSVVRRARLGRVALARDTELQDSIAGPRDVFTGFQATVVGLPPGVAVTASWDGALALRVDVRAPRAAEAALRALLDAPFLALHPAG